MESSDIEEVGWTGREEDIRSALIRWYKSSRRHLPWRGDPPPWGECKRKAHASGVFQQLRPRTHPVVIDLDEQLEADAVDGAFPPSAYGVWVSEVMLQQTQVQVVIPFWRRWMKRLPTLEALCGATLAEVNSLWSGLGFYGRAKRLHEGAKYVLAKHCGSLPRDLEALRRIPGVGPYTAGAIASIAFGQQAALVDGNVARVFSRLSAIALPAKSPSLMKMCWTLADQLVDPEDPGTFNQALMELGATVCTPKTPTCDKCPLQSACRAHELVKQGQLGHVTHFPAKAILKKRRERVMILAAVNSDGAWMFVRRPPKGLLGGQLNFPSLEVSENEALCDVRREDAVGKLKALLLEAFKLDVDLRPVDEPVEHQFSHEHHVMHIFRGECEQRPPLQQESKQEVFWLTAAEAQEAGITSYLRKVGFASESVTKPAGHSNH